MSGRICVDGTRFHAYLNGKCVACGYRPNGSESEGEIRGLEMKSGDRVVIVDSSHPWFQQSGVLVALEKYGLGRTGWRTKLDNGFETYVKPAEVRSV